MASKRGYLSQDELAEFAEITITDATEADDQISMAEEMIDDYVGAQPKFYNNELKGKMSAAAAGSFTLEADIISAFANSKDYFKGMHVEIIGGTGSGQLRKISGSSVAGVLSVESNFSTVPDTTSIYKIFQIGKFPRHEDVFLNSKESPPCYYKSIPEDLKRATAAQVEYRINMGDNFFSSDGEEMSEHIGDYSVTRKAGSGGTRSLIAPKARLLLRGIMNRTGEIVV